MKIGNETVLPRRVIPQPTPRIYEGGDCGACVLGGLFDLSVDKAYEVYSHGAKREPITYYNMMQALHDAQGNGSADRVITSTPLWPTPVVHQAWGWSGAEMANHWFNYLQMGFDAGYYAIALVDIQKRGPNGGGTNHWVMLCGVRDRYGLPGAEENANRIYQEVLVSCSAGNTPDESWEDSIEFLEYSGGFNVLLVRPT